MAERFHVGTFALGVVLTLAGAALAAVGFGWWKLSVHDLRYVAPAFLVFLGTAILIGALTKGGRGPTEPHLPGRSSVSGMDRSRGPRATVAAPLGPPTWSVTLPPSTSR
jgi:hypothetical protein